MKTKTFNNPVISGFHPDPSVCRCGDDYFLVTSSMEYFPGIPVFHSRDLVHWQQIGHVLETAAGLNLDGVRHSGGIMAATIRYHDGIFYVACMGNGAKGHFICKTEDPFKGWSEPYQIGGEGIDSSLFFDDDGKAWFTANRKPDKERFYGDRRIWMQEFDYRKMELVGEIYPLWSGTGGEFCEAPHIYKRNGWYYLMVSEASTFHPHAVTIARSRTINGEYEPHTCNPILTHRHLSRSYPITNVGHADIIETQNGDWWGFALGSRHCGEMYEPKTRNSGGYYRLLGRETYLFPVTWEREWPVFCPDSGKIEMSYPLPLPEETAKLQPDAAKTIDDFNDEQLACDWVFLRTPRGGFMSLSERKSHVRLKLKPDGLEGNPAMICRRQDKMRFSAETKFEFEPQTENECAGMAVFLEDTNSYLFLCVGGDNNRRIQLIKRVGDDVDIIADAQAPDDVIYMRITGNELNYSFYVMRDGKWDAVCGQADGRILTMDYNEPRSSHTGVMIGLYTSSNGHESSNYADFDWFEYK